MKRAIRYGGLTVAMALWAAAGSAAEVTPLAMPECIRIRELLETAIAGEIGLRFQIAESDDDLRALGASGRTCRLAARAGHYALPTEADGTQPDPARRIEAALAADGWTETARTLVFSADGPDGTRFARSRGADTCVVRVHMNDFRRFADTVPEPPALDHEIAYAIEVLCFGPR